MDPHMLIEPAASSVIPAPFWFVEFFKVLGFALHAAPMGLWYAGIAVAMVLHVRGGEHGRRFSARLMTQMPVIVAAGVNLGVVPLLFVQVAYARVFYPATILMAWSWLAIIALLIPAYYGVYLYSFGVREGEGGLTPLCRAAGWGAAVLFIVIGFTFANGWSLMTRVEAWPELWRAHSVAGAALGTALNLGDATLWPRWLMFFGLALTTTAAWIVFDAAWFGASESDEYGRWAADSAWKLYTAGAAWFALFGAWYALGAWSDEVRRAMFLSPLVVLTLVTALAPGLPWALLFLVRKQGGPIPRPKAALVAAAQFGVVAVNAVSRQIVQNIELSGYFSAAAQKESVQWGPLVMFLVVFVAGLGVVAWMVAKVVRASQASAS